MRFLAHLSTGTVKIPFDCRRCNTNSLISYWCYFGVCNKKKHQAKPDAMFKINLLTNFLEVFFKFKQFKFSSLYFF